MGHDPANLDRPFPSVSTPAYEVPFGVNEMRLTPRQWLAALAIVAIVLIATPIAWKPIERVSDGGGGAIRPGPDYRIPYSLSKDYWLYEHRLADFTEPSSIVVLGDSVIWGEYVRPDGTLSHFLNQQWKPPEPLASVPYPPGRFVNGGVNGLFPLAMEGLVEHYAGALRNRKVIVHCNLLWMTSPKADLSINREESFNHSRLVPQFSPRVPCYRADAAERLSVTIEEHVPFSSWVGHLQNAYYDQKSIPAWTLQDDGNEPPSYPNAWRAPWAPITLAVPGEPPDDPQRGPTSPRHVPWSDRTSFDWVPLDRSLQWGAFQRVVTQLRARGNDVLVIVGPLNQHMIVPEQVDQFLAMRRGVEDWLARNQVNYVAPEVLPSEMYADTSHPLTEGYTELAHRIVTDRKFQQWLTGK